MTDPDKETVYVATSISQLDVYHSDRSCDRIPSRYRETDRESAEAWDLRECEWCQGVQPNIGLEIDTAYYRIQRGEM